MNNKKNILNKGKLGGILSGYSFVLIFIVIFISTLPAPVMLQQATSPPMLTL